MTRTVLAGLLAVIAIAAAGVWALAQFGQASNLVVEARPPIVREPEIVAADAPVQPPSTNPGASLRTAPAAPAAADVPAPAEPAAPAAPGLTPFTTLDSGNPASPAVPPSEPVATPQNAPAAPSAQARVAPQPAPGSTAAAETAALEAQFKSRRITYNRPPAKLAIDKPIDVSLVINATDEKDAGKDALQGFPGTVVERDVELSDTVSAQLTGVGFNITSQTVERQRLSGRMVNRWQWRVTPTELGTRTLILEIFGYASGSLDAEPLDSYRDDITVEVEQFDQVVSWAKAVQPLFAVIAALAAIGSAIFAFLRFREEKKQTKAVLDRNS